MLRVDALIDTGATGPGIRRDIAEHLGLRAKGNRRVLTANGFLMADDFLFRVGIVFGDHEDPAFEPDRSQPFILENRIVGFGLETGFPYPLLIGMDVIGAGNLVVCADGTAEFEI